jgi:hypothetical protein
MKTVLKSFNGPSPLTNVARTSLSGDIVTLRLKRPIGAPLFHSLPRASLPRVERSGRISPAHLSRATDPHRRRLCERFLRPPELLPPATRARAPPVSAFSSPRLRSGRPPSFFLRRSNLISASKILSPPATADGCLPPAVLRPRLLLLLFRIFLLLFSSPTLTRLLLQIHRKHHLLRVQPPPLLRRCPGSPSITGQHNLLPSSHPPSHCAGHTNFASRI